MSTSESLTDNLQVWVQSGQGVEGSRSETARFDTAAASFIGSSTLGMRLYGVRYDDETNEEIGVAWFVSKSTEVFLMKN